MKVPDGDCPLDCVKMILTFAIYFKSHTML